MGVYGRRIQVHMMHINIHSGVATPIISCISVTVTTTITIIMANVTPQRVVRTLLFVWSTIVRTVEVERIVSVAFLSGRVVR